MTQRRRKLLACFTIWFAFTAQVMADAPLQILTMGDSLMASNRLSKQSIPNVIGSVVGARVLDRSVSGARVIYKLPISGSLGMNILKQYKPGNWDWIVVNGGGNDLWLGCGCKACDRKMDQLIAAKGWRGEIPRLVHTLRKTGAQVVYVGYLRSPGFSSPIESCRDEGTELERRIKALAATDRGFHFVSLTDLVPPGDKTYHAVDRIHPSVKGSREIGKRVGRFIKQR